MIRTTATGHENNQFIDNDPTANPPVPGTIVDALWLNNTQEEICKIIEDAGLSVDQSGATRDQLRQALDLLYAPKAQVEQQFTQITPYRELGDLVWKQHRNVISASSPYLCLSDESQVIQEANYPDYVSYLRARKITFDEGGPAEKSDFNITNWTLSANIFKFTLADTTAENALLDAMSKDNIVHGSFTDWWVINLPAAIGDIPAGEYAIEGIDPINRKLSGTTTVATTASGTTTEVIQVYPHRVVDSTTSARVYRVGGRALQTPRGDFNKIGGTMFAHQVQMHGHKNRYSINYNGYGSSGSGWQSNWSPNHDGMISTKAFITQLSGYGSLADPNTGLSTEVDTLVAYLHVYVGAYIA